jgi:Tfp pilus assembly protein PilX
MTQKAIHSHIRRRRGFLMLDVVTGLLLLLVTLALLTNVAAHSRVAARRLADDRAAIRLAEATLLARNGRSPTTTDDRVDLMTLDAAAPVDRQWASATATINGRHVEIIGLVPTTRPVTGATR